VKPLEAETLAPGDLDGAVDRRAEGTLPTALATSFGGYLLNSTVAS